MHFGDAIWRRALSLYHVTLSVWRLLNEGYCELKTSHNIFNLFSSGGSLRTFFCVTVAVQGADPGTSRNAEAVLGNDTCHLCWRAGLLLMLVCTVYNNYITSESLAINSAVIVLFLSSELFLSSTHFLFIFAPQAESCTDILSFCHKYCLGDGKTLLCLFWFPRSRRDSPLLSQFCPESIQEVNIINSSPAVCAGHIKFLHILIFCPWIQLFKLIFTF